MPPSLAWLRGAGAVQCSGLHACSREMLRAPAMPYGLQAPKIEDDEMNAEEAAV